MRFSRKLALMLAVLLVSGPAVAGWAAEGNIPNDGNDYSGWIVVITRGRTHGAVTHCFTNYIEYDAVMLDPGSHRAVTTRVGIVEGTPAGAGDRFIITSQETCNGSYRLTLDPL